MERAGAIPTATAGLLRSLRLTAVAVASFLAIAATPDRGACVGTPNVVVLKGVVGGDAESGAIGKLHLVHGDRSIPFAVVSAQRVTGGPAEGVEVLKRLGPGVPQIRVVGTDAVLAPLLEAKSGTMLQLRGLLDDGTRYLQLLEAGDLPGKTPDAAK